MFQLNSYNAKTHLKWFGKNIKKLIFSLLSGLMALGALTRAFSRLRAEDGSFIIPSLAFSVIVLTLGIIALMLSKKETKKKLVFTHRVIRLCATSAFLYALGTIAYFASVWNYYVWFSQELNQFFACLFVIIFCAHMGGLALWGFLAPIVANFINAPFEKWNNNRYIKDAKRIIAELPDLVTIGITGSYGKTTTKFYLDKLLSVKYNVLPTPESYNTTLGVVKTVRGSLNATHEIFICEMGAKSTGEIKEICDIVKPRHSIITSIGPQHLETFKSIENVINTKFEIADCVNSEGGKVFLNFDNDYIKKRAEKFPRERIIGYSINAQADCDYKATDITVSENGTEFTVAKNDEEVRFSTRLLGAHVVQNITGAIAVAHTLGVSLKELALPVKRLEPVKHRLQIINRGKDIIIDDAFNSNPSGAKAALDVLKLFDGCKILITPGMIELGVEEFALNKKFGEQAAASCDYALLIGRTRARPIKEGLLEAGFPEEKIKVFDAFKDGMAFEDAISAEKRKVVLIENDLPDNYS